MNTPEVFKLIETELHRQDIKWGENRKLDQRTWVVILLEEVGEVARASLEHDDDNYIEELTQVAAVCIAMIKAHSL